MESILTTCCFCGCGCGIYLQVEEGRVQGAMPSRSHPIARGNLCVKGWHVHDFIHSADRLTVPLIRRGNDLSPASWDEALDFTAASLKRILANHGGQAVGVLASAKCTNEENYLLQKLARRVLNTNSIDHCARL